MITVKDITSLEIMSDCQLIAGQKGLNREVRFVTINEIPEVTKWLTGGEIILTSLIAIRDDGILIQKFVEDLVEINAAALFIKTSYTNNKVPDVLITYGDLFNFPVFLFPNERKYVDIMPDLLTVIMNESVIDYKKLDLILTVLDSISILTDGVEAYIKQLNLFIHNTITIETTILPNSVNDISELKNQEIDELLKVCHTIPLTRKMNREVVEATVSPIILDSVYFGNLTSWKKYADHTETELKIIEKVTEKISFEILKIKLKLDIESQYESEFLREILFSDTINLKNIEKWGERYKISNIQNYAVYIFSCFKHSSIWHKEVERNKQKLSQRLKAIHSSTIIGLFNDDIIIVIPEVIDNSHDMDSQLINFMKLISFKMFSYAAIGKSKINTGVHGIRDGYLQAERAIIYAKKNKIASKIICYEQIGINRIIYALEDTDEYEKIYEETISKLLGDEKGFDLINTIGYYFDSNENLKETAERLFIHVNTLKYRLKKIEEKTNLSFHNTDDKLMFYLGLLVYKNKLIV